jgi:hypothetical protein
MWPGRPQAERGRHLDRIDHQERDMSTSALVTRHVGRLALVVPVAALAVLGPALPAGAHEATDHTAGASRSAYAEPLEALDGQSLAQYLTDHVARILGPVGV